MKKKRPYRFKLVLAGFVFFVLALGLSSTFLFFGNNTISGENISISVTGPLAVGGGSEIPLQISVANQNAIPIESATLIIDYPPGSQSAAEPGKEVFSERLQLNEIGSGQVVNVPARALVFGEENEEKTIHVSIEYRVRGSNATFFKEAEPLRFKISSSPVILDVKSLKSISSGQEVTFELTVASNSPTPISNVLVKAVYPFGFDFSESKPDAVSGRDTWLIKTLEPRAKEIITVKGLITGKQDENRVFSFSAGVPNERDRFSLASVFTTAKSEVTIEQPFLGIDIEVNGESDQSVTIGTNESASVRIAFENTLSDTIYDGVIEAKLTGNALNETQVIVNEGFYNSTSNTITWDPGDVSGLREIQPGRSSNVSFSLKPSSDVGRTPEIKMVVTVKGKRVFEDRVPQELQGTAERSIKIASKTSLSSVALYSEGSFSNFGPVPPVAERRTDYTLKLKLKNGSNDITNAEVTAVLPQYVTWLDEVTSGDNATYNETSRVITWKIGDVDANKTEEVEIHVSMLPSLTQIGTTPTILEEQRLRATDRFTGSVLRTEAPALTTRLYGDPEYENDEGRVQAE